MTATVAARNLCPRVASPYSNEQKGRDMLKFIGSTIGIIFLIGLFVVIGILMLIF